jgi:Na+/melibiose symporter-like transporter
MGIWLPEHVGALLQHAFSGKSCILVCTLGVPWFGPSLVYFNSMESESVLLVVVVSVAIVCVSVVCSVCW